MIKILLITLILSLSYFGKMLEHIKELENEKRGERKWKDYI